MARRKPITGPRLIELESRADDLLHWASGSANSRDIRHICRALGWPAVGSVRAGVAWSKPRRNFAECYSGDRDQEHLERLVLRGFAELVNRWPDGLIEYRITPKGQAVAYLRHMALREAVKVV